LLQLVETVQAEEGEDSATNSDAANKAGRKTLFMAISFQAARCISPQR
jgi:hypothetical protein